MDAVLGVVDNAPPIVDDPPMTLAKAKPQVGPKPVWPRGGYLVLFKDGLDVHPADGALAVIYDVNDEGIGNLVIHRPRGNTEYRRGVHYVSDEWFNHFPENKTRGCWDWHPNFPKWMYEMAQGGGNGSEPAPEPPDIQQFVEETVKTLVQRSSVVGNANLKLDLVEWLTKDDEFKKALKAALK